MVFPYIFFIEKSERNRYNKSQEMRSFMRELKHPPVCVEHNGTLSYGGCQTWSESPVMSRCGCGVVSSLDLLIYLADHHSECNRADFPDELLFDVVREKVYDAACRKLSRRYLPLMYPFGINGLTLVLGLNLFFVRHGFPYRAFWGVRRRELWDRIDGMLAQDLPVILSIGPNFPRVWEKKNASLYSLRLDGSLHPAAATHSHFLTVTGMDEQWLTVSSWGRKYYISRKEYEDYVSENSNGLFSSIVCIQKK